MKYNYTLVDDREKALAALNELLRTELVAVDLEFDKNRYRYGFTMCLMQMATPKQIFLIDPLAKDVDPQIFFELLENETITKLAFEFGEDLRLFHHIGCTPHAVYDLSLATKLLDHPQTSLANMLHELLGVESEKSSQKSNWIKRPLSDMQLNYAAGDVAHLLDLYALVEREIEHRNLRELLQAELAYFNTLDFSIESDSKHFKTKDMDGMSEADWFVFESLIALREAEACKLNRPAYQVLDKDFLLALSKSDDALKNFFNAARAHPKLQSEAFKNRLFETLKNARAAAVMEGKSSINLVNPKPSPAQWEEIKAMKKSAETMINDVLKPIQLHIKQQYGEHAGTFLLSGKLMQSIAGGDKTKLKPHVKTMMLDVAQKLGLKLNL